MCSTRLRTGSGVLVAACVAVLSVGGTAAVAGEAISPLPCLVVQKVAPSKVIVGSQIKYEIRVHNAGGAPALDVLIRDELPSGVRFVSATPATKLIKNALTWKLGSILPLKTQTISVVVVATAPGMVRNCITYSLHASRR